jgi:TrmH family RNA methyltransferase
MIESLKRVRIVLVEPQHPGNIGSVARAMHVMGLAELALVRPACRIDARAQAQATHAVAILERACLHDTLEPALAGCAWVVATSARPRHLGDEPLTPWAAAQRLLATATQADTALVFGPERVGLSNEDLDRCHATTMIPANPEYSSLNLAQAVQVYAYELRKQALAAPPKVAKKRSHPNYAPPTAEELARFYDHLERVLLATGFLDPANPRLLMRRLRQLFNRATPDRNELNILRGILATIEKPKPRKPPG